ncbi:MAG: hypothetical protein HZA88_05510 [Verrucomicrobia bacterium]|nr:hypothetical protein [Verrucomicrobiota bacterium]
MLLIKLSHAGFASAASWSWVLRIALMVRIMLLRSLELLLSYSNLAQPTLTQVAVKREGPSLKRGSCTFNGSRVF